MFSVSRMRKMSVRVSDVPFCPSFNRRARSSSSSNSMYYVERIICPATTLFNKLDGINSIFEIILWYLRPLCVCVRVCLGWYEWQTTIKCVCVCICMCMCVYMVDIDIKININFPTQYQQKWFTTITSDLCSGTHWNRCVAKWQRERTRTTNDNGLQMTNWNRRTKMN